jgi:hypothetical protein
MATLPRRLIEATIKLATDSGTNQPNKFAESGGDTVTLSGSRCKLRVQNSGAANGSTAQFSIYGLTLSLMDQLSTLGLVFNIVPKNTITITAGDEGGQMSTVFSGTIFAAYGDFNSAPDVPFHIEAIAGLADAIAPVAPSSFASSSDVATLMGGFARQMGLGFENNGVSIQLPASYFPGTIWDQVKACAEHAHINVDRVDGPAGPLLAIWPIGGNRTTPNVPMVAAPPAGQMIGYPSYTQQGIKVDNIFNPQISRGQLIQVDGGILKKATGKWAVTKIDHALDSLVPKGNWMSTLYCYNPNLPQPLPPSTS